MDLQDEILRVLKIGTPSDALLLASSFPKARTKQIFALVAEDSKASFQAIKYIDEAKRFADVVLSAAQTPEFARIIVEDLPEYRIDEIFRFAVNNEPYWANFYVQKYGLKQNWVRALVDKYKKRPDISPVL